MVSFVAFPRTFPHKGTRKGQVKVIESLFFICFLSSTDKKTHINSEIMGSVVVGWGFTDILPSNMTLWGFVLALNYCCKFSLTLGWFLLGIGVFFFLIMRNALRKKCWRVLVECPIHIYSEVCVTYTRYWGLLKW